MQAYVLLLDEGVTVYRPIAVEHLKDNVYLVCDQEYDRETETWEFEPGDIVVCEFKMLSGAQSIQEKTLVAIRKFDRDQN